MQFPSSRINSRSHLVLLGIVAAWSPAWLLSGPHWARGDGPGPAPMDWAQFRGGTALGLADADAIPLDWTASQNVAWRTAIPGAGWSQPVVADGRIYLTTAIVPGGRKPKGMSGGVMDLSTMGWGKVPKEPVQWRVMCLEPRDGSLIWSRTAVETVPKYGTTGTLVALDRDGNERWKREFGPQAITNAFGTGASPVLFNGKLLVQLYSDDRGDLVCLDAATGEEMWTAKRNSGASWATPIVWDNKGTTEIVTGGQGSVIAYRLTDGTESWRYGGLDTSFACSLVADGEAVYFGTSSPGSKAPAAAINAGHTGDLTLGKDQVRSSAIPWSRTKSGAGMPSPVVVGDHLYFFGTTATCYDKRTGEEKYRKRLPGGTQAVGCPLVIGNRIYVVNEAGKTIVLATGPEFKVLAESELAADNEVFWATPAASGTSLLIRSSDAVYCIRSE